MLLLGTCWTNFVFMSNCLCSKVTVYRWKCHRAGQRRSRQSNLNKDDITNNHPHSVIVVICWFIAFYMFYFVRNIAIHAILNVDDSKRMHESPEKSGFRPSQKSLNWTFLDEQSSIINILRIIDKLSLNYWTSPWWCQWWRRSWRILSCPVPTFEQFDFRWSLQWSP